VRDQFLVEAGDGSGVADLAELNRLFHVWTETSYHRAVHSETGEAPAERWEKATPAERAVPEPCLLREAFLWSERRKADKTALVRMHGNACQVDAWLAGRTVELLFSPFDLDRVEVRPGGKPAGAAVPFTVGPAPPPQGPPPRLPAPHRARPHRDRLPRRPRRGPRRGPARPGLLPVPRQRPPGRTGQAGGTGTGGRE
jgi:putative transposase